MLRVSALAALVLLGCGVAIPTVRLVDSPKSPPGREVEVCRLTAEVRQQPLLAGIDALTLKPWHQVIGSVVVKHPRGLLIVDPAFGKQIGADLFQSPLWFRLVMGGGLGKAAILDLLTGAGIEEREVRWVALTHSHWDHASALRDLPWTKVLLSRAELTHLETLKGHLDHGTIPRHFEIDPGRFAPFEFEGGPRNGFDRSHDLFGDGSVVAVPLPGHTPGSTGYLITGQNGRRWLLIGDAAWAAEGVSQPVGKNRIASMLVDFDREQTAQTLGLLHALQLSDPQLMLVPSHDLSAMESIPLCTR